LLSKNEVLRDGASAQYGSDAIAGVQHQHEKKTLKIRSKPFGSHFSKMLTLTMAGNDGNNIQIDLNWNKFGKVSLILRQVLNRGQTSRAKELQEILFNRYNAVEEELE
jgi:outer membrane cobalamin receptor